MAEVSHVVFDEEGRVTERNAAALAYGFQNCAFAAGTLIGPLWGGMMVEYLGWGTMGWSLGLLCGLSVMPIGFVLGKKK